MRSQLGYYLCSAAACAIVIATASPSFADEKLATFSAAPDSTITSDLSAKLEQAIGRIPRAPTTAAEQRRNERRAMQLAEELLRSEGFYSGTVETQAATRDEDRFSARLIINPGPQFRIRDAGIEWVEARRLNITPRTTVVDEENPAAVAAEIADSTALGSPLPFSGSSNVVPIRGPAPVHPHEDIVDIAIKAMDLPNGAPARAADIVTAEARIITSLQANGFADARPDPRYVEVIFPEYQGAKSASADTVRPRFNIMARELVYLEDEIILNPERRIRPADAEQDDLVEEPLTRTRRDWVQQLVPWKQGQIFSPQTLSLLEQRLTETGVYDSVSVSLAPIGFGADADDGLRDVYVNLTDRPHKLLEAGASYATDDGYGLDVFRTNFNRFGRADTLRYGIRIANIDSRLGGEWSRPHFRRSGRTLKSSAWLINENTDAYTRQAASIDVEATQRWREKSSFSLGLGIDGGRYKETRYDPVTGLPVAMDRDLVMLTLRGGANIDRANDPLNSTHGWRGRVSVQPTAVTGEDDVFFLRGLGEGSTYYPLGAQQRTILAGRIKLGSIIGGSELTVPADRLMYAGGGGSVRGYSYQGINPRLPDNTPRGGLSLAETSFEVRHNIGTKYQAVVFLDGGSIGFQETPTFSNMRYGAGVGARYFLPFGPIRADIAFPLNKREGDSDFQLYISIGQSF